MSLLPCFSQRAFQRKTGEAGQPTCTTAVNNINLPVYFRCQHFELCFPAVKAMVCRVMQSGVRAMPVNTLFKRAVIPQQNNVFSPLAHGEKNHHCARIKCAFDCSLKLIYVICPDNFFTAGPFFGRRMSTKLVLHDGENTALLKAGVTIKNTLAEYTGWSRFKFYCGLRFVFLLCA